MGTLKRPVSLSDVDAQKLLICVGYSLIPKALRPQVDATRRWSELQVNLADLLIDAHTPSRELMAAAWLHLASRAGKYPALARGITLLGHEVPSAPDSALPPALNPWQTWWEMYVAFGEDESSFSWLPNAMIGPIWDVMVANKVPCLGSDAHEGDDYVDLVGDYVAESLFAFAEDLDLECWKTEIAGLLINGPKNVAEETCYDVVNRVAPNWRSLEL
jgi:hypothetical protein